MSLFDLAALDEIPDDAVSGPAPAACSFCDTPVHLQEATEHPCCGFARHAGRARCEGCTNFAYRQLEERT